MLVTYYTSVTIISWAALAVLCILVHENDRMTRNDKVRAYLAYAVIALAALSEWLGVQLSGNTENPVWVLKMVKCADYILTPASGWMLAEQLKRKTVIRRIIFGLVCFNTIFQIIASFTGWMTVVDSQNHYTHGPCYPAYEMLYFLLMLLIVADFISYGRKFRRQNQVSMYAILLLVLIGILMQELISGELRTAYLALTFGAALLYIHTTEFTQLKADDEIQSQQFQIMMSQIKPHFLFNCLAVIGALYRTDVDKGDKALAQFSDLLRYDIDSLNSDKPIDFLKEFEHSERYLELQKLRFGNKLNVEYDLECTDFLLPTLTLQPIVENAVTYGARESSSGAGLVTIMTRESGDHYEVVVKDNGPGFDPDNIPDDGERSHIGIKNVKERLQRACGGSLKIDSVPGEGTTVTMIIPKASDTRQ